MTEYGTSPVPRPLRPSVARPPLMRNALIAIGGPEDQEANSAGGNSAGTARGTSDPPNANGIDVEVVGA